MYVQVLVPEHENYHLIRNVLNIMSQAVLRGYILSSGNDWQILETFQIPDKLLSIFLPLAKCRRPFQDNARIL